ncbi:hypothetical protein [Thaumasiovibrio sp. DFM-14]|uniref:hypothetical protein n=1 Tax=Thaumasiovibrio sp. DFM-14 TaxID=3384792 RepID=UPI0039A14B3C
MQVRSYPVNFCKTVTCDNFGKTDIAQRGKISHRLGFPSLHCHQCGGHPPLVDGEHISVVTNNKLRQALSATPLACPRCMPLAADKKAATTRYGKTAKGSQRYACQQCQHVFSFPSPYLQDKDILLLENVLQRIPVTDAIQQLKISPKTYYASIQRTALRLEAVTRLMESRLELSQARVETHSEVLNAGAEHRLWCLFSQFIDSNYVLLASHNVSGAQIDSDHHYISKNDTQVRCDSVIEMKSLLEERYRQLLSRYHFEDLNYGPARGYRHAVLIKPADLCYVHFNLLAQQLNNVRHQVHYIEHESCLRSGALSANLGRFREQSIDICYKVTGGGICNDLSESGQKVSWWQDKWYPMPEGSISAITPYSERVVKQLGASYRQPTSCFYSYLSAHLPKGLRSYEQVNALIMLHRFFFNYVEVQKDGTTPAMRAGLAVKPWSLSTLDETLAEVIESL